MGGTYVSMIGNKRREHIFGVGDPSYPGTKDTLDLIVGDINPFKKKKQYWEYTVDDSISKIDKINYQTVYAAKDDWQVEDISDDIHVCEYSHELLRAMIEDLRAKLCEITN